jgi:hypothetical protein
MFTVTGFTVRRKAPGPPGDVYSMTCGGPKRTLAVPLLRVTKVPVTAAVMICPVEAGSWKSTRRLNDTPVYFAVRLFPSSKSWKLPRVIGSSVPFTAVPKVPGDVRRLPKPK